MNPNVPCVLCNGTGRRVKATTPGGSVVLMPCNALVHYSQEEIKAYDRKHNTHNTIPKKKTPWNGLLESSKETKMAVVTAPSSVGDVFQNVTKQVADAAVQAGKTALATKVSQGMISAAKEALGDSYPQNPLADHALQLLLPISVMLTSQLLAAQAPGVIPAGLLTNLNAAASLALQGVSHEKVNALASQAMPFLLQIGALGAQALAAGGQNQLDAGILDGELVQ